MPIVTPSPITPVETAPASPEAVWGLSRMLLHDWTDPIELTSSWPGAVFAGGTSAERRVCYVSRPLRTLKFTMFGGCSAGDSRLLRHWLYRTGVARSLVPLWPDQTYLTAAASANVITCDTTARRLAVGARVAVVAPSVVNAAQFEVATIASLTPTAITLAANLTTTYPANSRVFPLLECDVEPAGEAKVINGRLTAQVTAAEVPGSSALPAIANRGDVLTAFGSYGGVPVFDPGLSTEGREFDWHATSSGWQRDNVSAKAGQGTSYNLLGPRPRLTSKRTAAPVTRANAWPLIQMFDACRGQTYPVLAPEPFALMRPVAVTSTTVTVPAAGPLADWAAVPFLAVVTYGVGPDQVRVRAISGTPTRSGGVDTVTLAAPLPDGITLAQVHSVTAAHLMRFDSPDLTERWTTTTNLSLSFGLVEVLNEATATIANL